MHNTEINQSERAKRGGRSSCHCDNSGFISSVSHCLPLIAVRTNLKATV